MDKQRIKAHYLLSQIIHNCVTFSRFIVKKTILKYDNKVKNGSSPYRKRRIYQMEKRLQVITGGTSGMGLATAKALSVYGPVLIGGRSEKRLAAAMAELKEAGVEVYGKPCDVSDKASLQAFVEYAVSIAPIGNVINAAGVDYSGMPKEPIIRINMLGTH